MELAMIVAVANNGIIGRNNELPWHIGSDLRRFKQLTMGYPIVMGRKTFESLGRVLPGRVHVVVTANPDWQPEVSEQDRQQVQVVSSWPAAVHWLKQHTCVKAFVIGGAQLFQCAIEDVSHFYLTRVLADVPGDVSFPELDWSHWELVQREEHPADSRNDFPYAFEDYRRLR